MIIHLKIHISTTITYKLAYNSRSITSSHLTLYYAVLKVIQKLNEENRLYKATLLIESVHKRHNNLLSEKLLFLELHF